MKSTPILYNWLFRDRNIEQSVSVEDGDVLKETLRNKGNQ